MNVLLKQAKIIDKSSSHHNSKKDILIENGIITAINDQIDVNQADKVISSKNLHVSQGWIDLKAHFCDPGHEYIETIETGLNKAASGGFTKVAILPSTKPVMDQNGSIDSVFRKAQHSATLPLPMGCLTKGMKGDELAELFDMRNSGAVMFTDDRISTSSGVLNNALMYAQNFNGQITVSVGNASLYKNAQVNEGVASLKTGLKGEPSISEVIEIERHLRILEHTNGRLHLSGVSTEEGARLIAAAKKKGLNVTAETHIMNLCFEDEKVLDFDTNFKTIPPLRKKSDVQALINALKEGVIDCVVSNHRPTNEDEKDVDFETASSDTPQLQTLFPALNSISKIDAELLVTILAERPAKILKIKHNVIENKGLANITIFDPTEKFDALVLSSKDKKYSPFNIDSLQGKVLGIMNNGNLKLN
jgi:dihydroorotase